jgi:uncharacterized membrane protein (UPF0127 family)
MGLNFHMLAVVVVALALRGCKQDKQPGPVNRNLPTTTMQIGSEKFTLEIARNDNTRQIGLMNRHSMPRDHGMIFVFPDESPRGFWMLNTYIPLDIIYAGADGKVVSIHSMKALDIRSVPSGKPAMYAIELNEGAAARCGVKVGDQLTIPAEAARADR